MKINRLILILPIIALCLTCCRRQQEVYNVTDHPLPDQAQDMSSSEIARIIKQTASNRGWECNNYGSNTVRCRMNRRGHSAVMDVLYTKRSFSIKHISTNNMMEDDGTKVHRNYNKWIRKMEKELVQALNKRGYSRN
jgi:hypothetical protein